MDGDKANKIQKIVNQKDEIEADEQFQNDLVEAMENYEEHPTAAAKAAAGEIKMEPFSMRAEVRGGIMTKDGIYKLKRERDDEFDMNEDDEGYQKEDDEWFKSMK